MDDNEPKMLSDIGYMIIGRQWLYPATESRCLINIHVTIALYTPIPSVLLTGFRRDIEIESQLTLRRLLFYHNGIILWWIILSYIVVEWEVQCDA